MFPTCEAEILHTTTNVKATTSEGFDNISVVYRLDRNTRFRRPIYPMLKQWNSNSDNGIPTQISLILASGWSRALKIVMNIDESVFRGLSIPC